jgi:hypothetical protein
MTQSFILTVGLESPTLTPDQARAAALELAGIHFPSGHTITEATGRWASPERGIIDEASLIVTVIGCSFASASDFSRDYKELAAQDSVLLQIINSEVHWV